MQISFNAPAALSMIWLDKSVSFCLFLLCKLTHFYRQVLVVYNAVNVEEIMYVNE